MSPFKTTADVRAITDTSTAKYICTYSVSYISFLALTLSFDEALGFTDGFAFGPAVFVAYFSTQRTEWPRFRSLPRFFLALFVGTGCSVVAVPLSFYLAHTPVSAGTAFSLTVTYTLFAGAIDAIRYLTVCVVTPGR